jgi:nucleotide-binding universal stress UspA family protein
MSGTSQHIIVGYDGSYASQHAVDWAADEAAMRHTPLAVIVVATPVWPTTGNGWRAAEHLVVDDADEILASGVARAAARAPTVTVTGSRVFDTPTAALEKIGAGASLLVVGNRGRGGVAGLSLGSVSARLAQLAPCPVVVVRKEASVAATTEPPLILIGLDGTDHDNPPMSFALAEAVLRGCELEVVHAVPRADPTVGFDRDAAAAAGKLFLDELVTWADRYPNVEVRPVLDLERPPAEALVSRAREAALIVVGSHGVGPASGIRLGSVSNAVLHAAPCPVAVVRPT